MTALAEAYPTLSRVLELPIASERRRRVLAVIAAFLDEGHEPSVREIAARAELEPGWRGRRKAELVIRDLDAHDLLSVEWARVTKAERRRLKATGEKFPRNGYELLLP